MEIGYVPVRREDGSAFAEFLAGETWPFHSGGMIDVGGVAQRVEAGEYGNDSVRTHWIVVDGRRRGFVKEAHYREAWPDAEGRLHDTIGYAILRRDWLTGETTPVDWAG